MRSCFLFEFDIGKGGVCTSFWKGSFFFFLPGSIPGRNFRNSKQWEKKGRGEMMDEGRERDGGKEGEVFPEQASETTKASEAETRIVRHRLAASSTEESTSG